MLKSKQIKLGQRGFTIVELLIVIVVIGILAALVLNTFANTQKRARDTERQTDTKSISTQLEVYYNDNGFYPIHSDITPANLAGMDEGAVRAPGLNTGTSITASPSANKDQYGYSCRDAANAVIASPVATTGCAKFELSYTKEDPRDGDTTPMVIKSLN